MSKSALIFSGSLRKDAYTKTIAKIIAGLCPQSKLDPRYIELNELPLPLLNQDETAPESFVKEAKEWKKLIAAHSALIIVTPEHNHSIPASLKNLIDWCSRPESEEENMNRVFKNKPALIVSSSVGPTGGIRAGNHLRQILSGVGCFVYPTAKPFMSISKLLNDSGQFIEEKHSKALQGILSDFADFI